MTPLEQRVVDRFRRHGDRFFRRLPDWPNTEITVGDENRLGGAYILGENGRPAYPRAYHHRIQLDVDAVLRAHTLIGAETLGDAVLVDAMVVADRKADGTVYRVHGWRHYHDELGRWTWLVMKTQDGHWLKNRWYGVADPLAEIRRSWR